MKSVFLKSYRIKKIIGKTLAYEIAKFWNQAEGREFWNSHYVLGYSYGLSLFNAKLACGVIEDATFVEAFASCMSVYTPDSPSVNLEKLSALVRQRSREFSEGSQNATLYGIYLMGGKSELPKESQNIFLGQDRAAHVRTVVWDEKIARGFRFQGQSEKV